MNGLIVDNCTTVSTFWLMTVDAVQLLTTTQRLRDETRRNRAEGKQRSSRYVMTGSEQV